MTNGTSANDTASVIIVGGGPVGTGLAITLGQRGIDCIIVERFETPQPVPKGQNLTQRTMEHFHFWGVENELRQARTIPPEYGIGGMTTYGTLFGNYSYNWLQRELVRPFYFTDNERLPQYATEAVLRERAAQLAPVQLKYGWTAENVTQSADGAQVTIVNRHSGEHRVLCGKYVVGCDGSRSLIRQQAGIDQNRVDHDRLMVLLVFRSEQLHRLLERFPGKSFYNVLHPDFEGYWQFFGRVDLGTTFFFHAPVPVGTTKDNFDFASFLHQAAGAEFDIELDYVGFWDLRFAVAKSYREGRIFIAGDAAHSHPPYGGYGINTGFEDAVNLGWKLAATLQGWGSERLLDTYDAERRPVFESTAEDFIGKSISADRDFLESFNPAQNLAEFEAQWKERASGAKSEVASFEPNYEGSPIVLGSKGKVSAIGKHAVEARAGHHLTPRPLSSGKNVYEELGPGLTLLAFDADHNVVEAFRRDAVRCNLPLKIVEDNLADGREDYAARLILVRPDQFVAWASSHLEAEPARLLKSCLGNKEYVSAVA